MLKNIADSIKAQISKSVLNQEAITKLALTAFFAEGHVLLTGPTGIGKTEWTKGMAKALGMACNRIRFAEGVTQQDVLGTKGTDELKRGPLFTQIFLAEGVHNASPKIKSILMDAMEEQTATIDGDGYFLPEPFFMVGTLEENQALEPNLADRFMLKLQVNYPGVAAEKQILLMNHEGIVKHGQQAVSAESIALAKQEVQDVAVEDAIFNNIISIVETTRRVAAVKSGASPRGSIALLKASKAYAAISGRDYVIMEDVQHLAVPVLRHRITLKPDAMQEGIQAERIIESILTGRRG